MRGLRGTGRTSRTPCGRRISSHELAKLSVLLELMRDQVEWNLHEALVETDRVFHDVVREAAHHHLLTGMTRTLTNFTALSGFLSRVNGDRSRELLDEHQDILCALRARDGERAERLAREHVVRDRARHAEAHVRCTSYLL